MFECFEEIKEDVEIRVGEISEELFNKACQVIEQDFEQNGFTHINKTIYIDYLVSTVNMLRRLN